ncbi:MAG: hypothetical protein OXU29_01875 [Gammaproteobacteria bacterium]|nr:hypothetical protein [Gammaproteobacteria bacterium]
MITFPYTDIINDAPAPLVIIFGMAHAAMAWIVFTYAKFFYRWIVGYWVKKSMLSEEKEKPLANLGDFTPLLDSYTRPTHATKVSDSVGVGIRKRIQEEVKRRMQESLAAHVVKCVVFGVCWVIIDTVKYFYG